MRKTRRTVPVTLKPKFNDLERRFVPLWRFPPSIYREMLTESKSLEARVADEGAKLWQKHKEHLKSKKIQEQKEVKRMVGKQLKRFINNLDSDS